MKKTEFYQIVSFAEGLIYGYYDENKNLIDLGMIDKIRVLRYIKALIRLEEAHVKYNEDALFEYDREAVITNEIGSYILSSIEDALSKNNKEKLAILMKYVGSETSRINYQRKLKQYYLSSVTLGNTEKLLDEYHIEGSRKYRILNLVYNMKQK